MATRQQARDAKDAASATLGSYGAVVTSIGVEEANRGFQISASLASGIEKIPKDLCVGVDKVPVHVSQLGSRTDY